MKGKSLYLNLNPTTAKSSRGGNKGVGTVIASKGAMKPFLTEVPKPLSLSILVIFKQPQKDGKNVKRFDDVDPSSIGFTETHMLLWKLPRIVLNDISSIQIVPQPQGGK